MPTFRHPIHSWFAALAVGAMLLVGCSDDSEPQAVTTRPAEPADCRPDTATDPVTAEAVTEADTDGVTVTLATHDSFATSDGIFDSFTADTGITVELLSVGDTGTLVSQSILTAGNPVADVLFGIDTTFLCRGTSAGLFVPYAPAALSEVDDDLEQAPDHLATPIDVGDVCLNYSRSQFADGDAPTSLEDLLEPALEGRFVTQNPETSSPGFAFLLATIATFGDDGWLDYWRDLRSNGLAVTSGWSEAYEDEFGFGEGERSVVTSYASSPVADVIYADPPRDEANIAVMTESCFRQVEFAGILRGTDHPEAAALLIDFMLSPEFQEDIPLNMFVSPANSAATVPAEYEAHRVEIDNPLTLSPAEIEANREAWTEAWTQAVLR